MPIYEYECSKCGEVMEILQKISDKPLEKCRHCSGRLHKLISHSSFHLKGTGWYVTDYAARSRSNSAPPKKNDDTKSSDSHKNDLNAKGTEPAPKSSTP